MKVYKPSMLISNNVPLTSKQLDVYNFLLKEAYSQLEKNYVLDTFEYSVCQLKEHFSNLDTVNRVNEFFDEIFEKEFNFNLLNKDKTIKAKVKSRFMSSIEDRGNGTFKVSLEPNTINALRLLVMKKKNIELPLNARLNSYAHLEFEDLKDFGFYPSKVVYEILKDYKQINIPLIETKLFKEATHTVNKFNKDYKTKVLKRIETDLAKKNILVSLEFKKSGRLNKWIKITKIKKEEFKKKAAPGRRQVVATALKTFGVKYIKELTKEQKSLLNLTLKSKGFNPCR